MTPIKNGRKEIVEMAEKAENKQTDCESCMYFDYDEMLDEDVCTLDLDEDEMIRFMEHPYSSCPYYKFYDEYKTVQKQN